MGWRDNLLSASYKGKSFRVKDVDSGVGRRNVVHQYPQRDIPYLEDLGRDADEFVINGYVIQHESNLQDYFAERDALITVLRESSPGTLKHPFLGEKQVGLVGKARIIESFDEGGIARFSMTFVEAGDVLYAEERADARGVVDTAAESALDLMMDGFGETYEVAEAVFSQDSIMGVLTESHKMMQNASLAVQGVGSVMISDAISDISLSQLGIDIDLISDTCDLASGIVNSLNGVLSLSGIIEDVVFDQLLGTCSRTVRGISSGPISGSGEWG